MGGNILRISVVGLRGFPLVQGGIETHCEHLYTKLANRDLEINIYGRMPYFKKKIDEENLKIIYLPCLRSQHLETFSYMIAAFFHILFNKPYIVHIHGIGPAFFAPMFRLIGCKVVLTHHGADYKRGKWGFFAKKILRLCEKMGIAFSNRIVVLNKSCPISLNKKSVVIPNGVDLPEQKNIDSGKYIFAIGRFVKEKGFHDLLAALSHLDTPAACAIAGKPDHHSKYSQSLIEKAKELKVELPGFVQGEAKEKLFVECGLFVIPSHHEGLPFALLEAMSYNCRILASDIPEHREIGLPEECYFPVGDVDALAKCLNNRMNSISSGGIIDYTEILMENYSWDKIAKQTLEVYSAI